MSYKRGVLYDFHDKLFLRSWKDYSGLYVLSFVTNGKINTKKHSLESTNKGLANPTLQIPSIYFMLNGNYDEHTASCYQLITLCAYVFFQTKDINSRTFFLWVILLKKQQICLHFCDIIPTDLLHLTNQRFIACTIVWMSYKQSKAKKIWLFL